ncbi:hypothetical protein HK22_05770 [Gluconobacter sp. DsW_056]|uniref:ABC transporter substrate-binding protein n=1 Tax=Gluconobacter sp. DsW_056 TaxID=1511209 RepID=UPI000B649CCD|nr:ABC transporter substrate-binding protein [Gluconobacter sp. DsW_056]OUI84307.1 hypothetical protein HK22_05770 [Gluconobacter sp. DsW_056]
MTSTFRTLLSLTACLLWGHVEGAQASSGVLRIAVNPIYPPLEFRDPVTDRLTGFDIDFGNALAARMGVKAEWVETAFPQMIPSVQSGRTDMILSGFSDRPERRAFLDFLDYLKSGAQVLVLSQGDVRSPEMLCGQKVAASRATSFPSMIRQWSHDHCEAQGHPAMVFYPSESGADARIQLLQGRVAAMVQGGETVGYFIDITHHAFRRLGNPLSNMLLSMAFSKGQTALEAQVAHAFANLRADGTYARLLQRWSLQDAALSDPDSDGSTP